MMTRCSVGRFAVIVFVFAIIGPIVGLVVFALGSGALTFAVSTESIQKSLDGSASTATVVFLYGMFLAHWIGGPAAISAGLLVAGYSAWRGRSPFVFGVVAGITGAIANGLLYGAAMMQSRNWGWLCVIAAVHVLPAIVCTRLTRRWQ
jgi:hypothetical protein